MQHLKTERSHKGWTPTEIKLLRDGQIVPGRSAKAMSIMRSKIGASPKRRPWSKAEDQMILNGIKPEGRTDIAIQNRKHVLGYHGKLTDPTGQVEINFASPAPQAAPEFKQKNHQAPKHAEAHKILRLVNALYKGGYTPAEIAKSQNIKIETVKAAIALMKNL